MPTLDELIAQRKALDEQIEIVKNKHVQLKDYGRETYLDGATMQFAVEAHDGETLAYFLKRSDAELFVTASNI